MKLSEENARLTLEKYLKDANIIKYEHSLRVAKMCEILAKKWDFSLCEDAIIAGLLHDIGKSVTRKEMLYRCAIKKLTMYDFDIFETPVALHGKVSAMIFEKVFDDKADLDRVKAISHAISCHVTGDTNMNLLDKILFIADNIEPAKKNRIFSEIQSGELASPDECIKQIILLKDLNAMEHHRVLDPLLLNTLQSLDER